MRRHAKATTAGSTKRLGKSKPALPLCVLAASVAVLALVVGSASGATTRFLVETFGSSAQPTFPGDRGMAVDQASGELYVLETNNDEIRRYNADGTPSNFAALGSNVIDGEGTGDETPDLGLAIAGSRSESQIAIDESGEATDGNIYVTESSRDQVSIFDSEGEYLGELSEHEAGAFNEPLGVAVDPSGNVYVGDFSSADLIHKYEPAANPPVNADNSASFATLAGSSSIGTLAAGAGATAGFIFVNRFNGELFKLDDTTGEIKYQLTTSASTVYVDPTTGHVFVPRLTGSNSEVVEYDASGGAEASKVSAFKPGSTVEGVAVANSGEQVYVSRSSTENVEVFGPAAVVPDVVTEVPTSNTGTRATLAGTVNPDGVELDECFFEWGPNPLNGPAVYGNIAPCAETPAEIGSGTSPVAVHADLTGLVPQGAPSGEDAFGYEYRLVASNPNDSVNGSNQTFNQVQTVFAEAATEVTPTEATLNGTVNPDTATISECVFEWGAKPELAGSAQLLPETAPCEPSPAGESPVAVSADITGLHPGTTYVYRLRVDYPTGAIVKPPGESLSLQTLGPVIEATWAEGVVHTEAVLQTAIDPEGAATTYRFEYGETEAYGSETEEASVGSDSSTHEFSLFLDELKPDTTYHYRAVATSGVAENVGPDHAFTTFVRGAPDTDCPAQDFRDGPSAKLPECRAYEMVTPLDKGGADIVPGIISIGGYYIGVQQASADGDKFTFDSAQVFGDVKGNFEDNQYIATRGANGWSTRGINPSNERMVDPAIDLNSGVPRFGSFTEDLSRAYLLDEAAPPLMPDAIDGAYNMYLRDNVDETYETLTKAEFATGFPGSFGFKGFSADGHHAVFKAQTPLTADAKPGTSAQVYDYHDGELELVSILPNGEPAGPSSVGHSNAEDQVGVGDTENAISDDGSAILWVTDISGFGIGRLFARINGETTVPVSDSVGADNDAHYSSMSADGKRVLFAHAESVAVSTLYRFDVETETPSPIAGQVQPSNGVYGASEDLSQVYFVSEEDLAPGATAGEKNIYLDEEGTKTFIATLAASDPIAPSSTADKTDDPSRVTPDGRHLLFLSASSLTGYDNTSLSTGEPAAEIYLYDADTANLRCISCNPGGARPKTQEQPWPNRGSFADHSRHAAAWLQTPRQGSYVPRVIGDDGDYVFFNSFDALVPGDTSSASDVYQWVEQGVDSCQKASGCVRLISTGTGVDDAVFYDASEGGRDVFFRTGTSVLAEDEGLVDIYNARVNGGFPSPIPPPDCFGDACQSVPSPPVHPTPASAGFRGAGDPLPQPNCGATARRAKKLSRRAKALRRKAKRARAPRRTKVLRKRSVRFARKAKGLSRRATRCRRSVRRASR